jgi:hypothetical protein
MFSKVHILSVRTHVNQFFLVRIFANRGFTENATINSPNPLAGRGIAVVHIGEVKKRVVLTRKSEKGFPWQNSNVFY